MSTEPLDVASLRQSWPRPSAPRPIVIIGAGGIVNDAHLPAYRLAGLPVAGVYDLDHDKARTVAAEARKRPLVTTLSVAGVGLMLLGMGADFDLTPQFRLSANANHLWFENTATLQVLRNEGSIPKDIGWDASVSAIWRPNASQNLVFRLSGAVLEPGRGFDNLFAQQGKASRFYSVLANATLAF